MDCCNYMQYRHQYYGSQYYEPMYHGDFYGQQMYQEYYNSTPAYYHQQWPCTASFPDYVYNPKEARIRKAMRDATRERSIGTSPMLPRPNARRAPSSSSHGWVQPPPPPPHDELMMSPLASMQTSSVCGFPLPSSAGSEQFMGALNAYNKLEAGAGAPPPPMPPPPPSTGDYMQSNPLAQLQQQAEMWPDYHQTMRPRPAGTPFMVPSYPSQSPEMAAVLEQPRAAATPPADDAGPEKDQDRERQFMPVFEQADEAAKMKKTDILHLPLSSQTFRASLFSNDLQYQHKYILEYFQSMPSMTLMNVTTPNGTSFPYATYVSATLPQNIRNESQVFENVSEPIFFHTDVGFVPMSSL